MTHFFGAHTIDNGGIHMAARRAGASGMKALQFFTAIPKFYGDKSSMKPERAERFRAALVEAHIDPRFVMAHSAYVLNTATAEEEKYSRAKAGLAKELERSTLLGIGSICFHPGAAIDGDREPRRRVSPARSCTRSRLCRRNDARARREHRGRGPHVRENCRRSRRHPERHSRRAAEANGIRPRHLSPVRLGLRPARERNHDSRAR